MIVEAELIAGRASAKYHQHNKTVDIETKPKTTASQLFACLLEGSRLRAKPADNDLLAPCAPGIPINQKTSEPKREPKDGGEDTRHPEPSARDVSMLETLHLWVLWWE